MTVIVILDVVIVMVLAVVVVVVAVRRIHDHAYTDNIFHESSGDGICISTAWTWIQDTVDARIFTQCSTYHMYTLLTWGGRMVGAIPAPQLSSS